MLTVLAVVMAVVVVGSTLTIMAMLIYSLLPSVARSQREAQNKAEEVVRSVLTSEEYAQLGQFGHLDVRSPGYPGRLYRIPSYGGTVGVLEGGRCVWLLCAQPVVSIPDPERVVIHKLMIEGNEEEYLKIANRLPC